MEIRELEALITNKDWSVLDHIAEHGSLAIPILAKSAKNPDPDVRRLSLLCLGSIKGQQAAKILVESINDEEEQVSEYAASLLLETNDQAILPDLLSYLSTHPNEYVRSKIALVIGIVGDNSNIERLKKQVVSDDDEDVRDCVRQALARLGDSESRKIILQELKSSDKTVQFQAMEKIEYINDKSLVSYLTPFLDDPSPVFTILSGPRTTSIQMKDAAVKSIAVLLNQPFSFNKTSHFTCTDEQIQEVKAFLKKNGTY